MRCNTIKIETCTSKENVSKYFCNQALPPMRDYIQRQNREHFIVRYQRLSANRGLETGGRNAVEINNNDENKRSISPLISNRTLVRRRERERENIRKRRSQLRMSYGLCKNCSQSRRCKNSFPSTCITVNNIIAFINP